MHKLPLNDISGDNDIDKLSYLLEQTAGFKCKWVDPICFDKTSQVGETCKLKALHEVMTHFTNKERHPSIVPLYEDMTKKPSPSPFSSLFSIARDEGSQVGEMYSMESLERLCNTMDFDSEAIFPHTTDEYVSILRQKIDNQMLSIVFFDVDCTEGARFALPRIGDGGNEHAVILIGYYFNEWDETQFIAYCWDDYYIYDGMELALSAFSLPKQHPPEVFFNDSVNPYRWSKLDEKTILQLGAKNAVFICQKSREVVDSETSLKGGILSVKPLENQPERLCQF